MSGTICIYHGNCADGFGSACVVRRALGEDVEFYPGVYQNPPPDVTGKHVILVDFSYKRPVLEAMIKVAASVLILDHHKTAEADLKDLPGATVVFDQEHSGAVIAWRHYFPGKAVPKMLMYIEDRDLWKFNLAYSREVAAGLFSYPYDFGVWMPIVFCLHDGAWRDLRQAGEAIERKHHKDIAELLEVCKRPLIIGGFRVMAANLPYVFSSDAGHKLCAEGPFGACYYDTPEHRVFSLRSTDAGEDVSAVAKLYGGGGHRNAAGFRVPLTEIEQFEI